MITSSNATRSLTIVEHAYHKPRDRLERLCLADCRFRKDIYGAKYFDHGFNGIVRPRLHDFVHHTRC